MGNSHHSIKKRLLGQRGAVVIWFALLLPVLLGLAALAIDLARLGLAKAELQNAADAAALGGARSLSAPGGQPYNWTVAADSALYVAQRNIANAEQIQQAQIETGYWNLQDPSLGFRDTLTTPVAGDVAAVRATVRLSSTENSGPLPFFFAPILGIGDSDIEASAIAVLPAAAGGTGFFPFAISQCILDELWDSDTNSPKLDPATDEPYIFQIGTPYPSTGCYTGQWTTFDEDINSASHVRNLITGDVTPPPMFIGDDTWIQPGVKASNYGYVPEDIDVALLVVNSVTTHSRQSVVAVVGFHIKEVDKHGNKSYVKGHFIDPKVFSGLDPGAGNGVPLGAYTPPVLVK